MQSQEETPISKLHNEILWAIFTINADTYANLPHSQQFVGTEPLTTTIRCSQVCQIWRNVILGSPSIWGRLICVFWHGSKWAQEALKRSGSSPLWIQALVSAERVSVETPASESARVLFFSILDEHWERIQYLNVLVMHRPGDDQIWAALLRPAPHLRSFVFKVSGRYPPNANNQQHHLFSNPWRPLFSNSAPSLQEYTAQNIAVKLRAPWLAQIRILDISDDIDVVELLDTLQSTPLLRSLSVQDTLPITDLASVKAFPLIELPNLQHITLQNASTTSNLAILDHLQAALGCSLNFGISTTDDHAQFGDDDPDFTNVLIGLEKPFSRYLRRHWPRHTLSSIALRFTRQAFILRYDSGTLSAPSSFFSIHMGGLYDFPETSLPLVYTPFISPFLDTITTLDIDLDNIPSSWYPGLVPLLSSLSSVLTLKANESTLAFLLAADPDSLQPFPIVHTLTIKNLKAGAKPSDGLLEFLRRRTKAGCPVTTLRVSTEDCCVEPFDLKSVLEEISGLRIVWEMEGKRMTEHVCGGR